MAITISGQNNNDKILASDGVLDQISGFNVVGVLTASTFETTGEITANHIDVGSTIQLGNAGIITATTLIGNVTGNVNSTSNLLLQISGSEKFRVGNGGQLGIGGANYGTSGQVLTSGGSGSAPTWSTIASDKITEGNTEAEVYDNGSDGRFTVKTEGSERFRITSDGKLGVGINTPTEIFHIRKNDAGGPTITLENNANKAYINNWGSTGGGSGRTNRFEINATNQAQASYCAPYHTFMTGGVGDSNEKLRIDSSGRVLIGTTTEGFAEADDLTINSADHGGITIRTPTNKEGNIAFSDTTSGTGEYSGLIRYRHSQNDLGLWTNSNLRLLIDSTGDIGLGESNPNRSGYSSPVVSVGYNSTIGYSVLELLGNKTDDNTIANIVAYNVGGSSRLAAIAFERSGANNTGAIRFETYKSGSSAERLRISSGGGIKITCDESFYAADLTECNTGQLALNINKTRQGQTKGIAFGAIGNTTTNTGIQCYDTSNNSANPLLLNPFGGNLALGSTHTSGYSNHTNFFLGGMGNLYVDTPAGSGSSFSMSNNGYINSAGNWVYRTGGKASNIYHYEGAIGFRNAGTGSAGNTISWSERLKIDSNGYVTKANNPSFKAYKSGGQLSINGSTVIVYDNATNVGGHNTGTHYNTSNGRFTAPIAGKYFISMGHIMYGSYTNNALYIRVNGSQVTSQHFTQSGSWHGTTLTAYVNLNANDYVDTIFTQTTTYYGGTWNHFAGHLVQ